MTIFLKKYIFAIYAILLLVSSVVFLYLDYIHQALPYDDVYSICMIKKSYAAILQITAQDVHPPLYYWGLKTYSLLFGDSLFSLRSFSFIGFFATLLLGYFPIRRLFGNRVALSFIILQILFPTSQYLVSDIRMYSWTMFFVLACGLYAYDVYVRGAKIDWLKFFVMGIIAAYLHNYALLGVFWIYIVLFTFMVRAHKKWLWVVLCGLLFIIFYSPWLYNLWWQIGLVSNDYWIKPLTVNDLFLHIYYFYSPKEVWLPFTDYTKGQMVAAIILVMAIQVLLTWRVWKSSLLWLIALVAFLLPVISGIAVSILAMPVIVPRYMTCGFGLFVLSIAFVLAKTVQLPRFRQLTYVFIILLSVLGIARYTSAVKYYKQTGKEYDSIRTFVGAEKTYLSHFDSYSALVRVPFILQKESCIPFVFLPFEHEMNFGPLELKRIGASEKFEEEFILIDGRTITTGELISRKFTKALESNYQIIDSLTTMDIVLYKMKARIKAVDDNKERPKL